MKRQTAAHNTRRRGVDRLQEIGPVTSADFAGGREQHAEETSGIAVPIAGQLHEVPLVAVVLFGESLGSFRVRVNDTGDETVVL